MTAQSTGRLPADPRWALMPEGQEPGKRRAVNADGSPSRLTTYQLVGMSIAMPPGAAPAKPDARTRLLEAALQVIRTQGYAGATVDELCQAAGVTKGAFFHHFQNKDALAIAAADYWSQITGQLFAGAPYHDHADPLERVLAYIDFRRDLIQGEAPDFTCLVGTMAQETYASHPDIRAACEASIFSHARTLEADIDEARAKYAIGGEWSSASLARHTQAVLQGAFILAKASGDANLARESVVHLRRYVELLFKRTPSQRRKKHG
ncbi:MAG: TetR/AcrR family transcriptional regulator [Hyphomonadaceae bacterium]